MTTESKSMEKVDIVAKGVRAVAGRRSRKMRENAKDDTPQGQQHARIAPTAQFGTATASAEGRSIDGMGKPRHGTTSTNPGLPPGSWLCDCRNASFRSPNVPSCHVCGCLRPVYPAEGARAALADALAPVAGRRAAAINRRAAVLEALRANGGRIAPTLKAAGGLSWCGFRAMLKAPDFGAEARALMSAARARRPDRYGKRAANDALWAAIRQTGLPLEERKRLFREAKLRAGLATVDESQTHAPAPDSSAAADAKSPLAPQSPAGGVGVFDATI